MALRSLAFLLLLSGPLFSQVEFALEEGAIRRVIFPDISPGEGYELNAEETTVAIAGRWYTDSLLVFKPAVPLRKGAKYRLIYLNSEVLRFETPAKHTVPRLVKFLPGLDTLPSNLLKIGLVFSEAMTEQGGVESLQLFDLTDNREIKNPFLDMATELWSDSGDTLTVWIDPGRIKRDLIPNKTLGPVLVPNHNYRVKVSSTLLSAHGVTMSDEYEFSFRASEADRRSPAPDLWTINIPSNENDVLHLEFNDVINPSSALHYITILASNGERIEGELQVSAQGSELFFQPIKYWNTGLYVIRIDSKLEDLAGNRLFRLFDDEGSKGSSNESREYYELRFHVN